MNLSVSWDDFLGLAGQRVCHFEPTYGAFVFYLSTFTSSKQEQHNNEEYF
jgi:hypothetical protein